MAGHECWEQGEKGEICLAEEDCSYTHLHHHVKERCRAFYIYNKKYSNLQIDYLSITSVGGFNTENVSRR
jgi:hypothetical protein